MSLSKCAVALATSLPVQCCCWILMASIQVALHPPGGWDHPRCSNQGQKTTFTKAKKMNSWEQWSQIPVWYYAGVALTAFPFGRATVERVCQALGASRMDAEHSIAHDPLPWLWTSVEQCQEPTDSRAPGSLGKSCVVTIYALASSIARCRWLNRIANVLITGVICVSFTGRNLCS